MSKVVLPPGKKPLATIRRVRDAADRVEDYGKLLEWLLVGHLPPPEIDKEQPFLGDYVQHYSYKFRAIADVNFALGVYNDIKHTNTKRGRPPEPDEIERAAKHLDAAILQLLLTMPWPVQRAVFVDPYFQLAKRVGIAAVLGLAGYGFLSFIVPALATRESSDIPRRVIAPAISQEEFAKQRWDSVERMARDTHASIDQLQDALTKWNQRWTALASNADGRRIAASTDATRAIAGLVDRKRPAADEIKVMHADVDKALTPLREAQKNRDYSRIEFGSESALFERIRRRASDEAAACNSALTTVDQLLSRAAASQSAKVTLQQAVDDLREADRLAKLEAERKAAEAVARASAERDAMVSARMAAYEKDLAARRAEYQRLRALAEDEQNKAKFEPFLAAGTRVPFRDHKGVRWRNDNGRTPGPATPMKYEWLIQARVLESAEDMIAVGTHAGNDRPTWSPPKTEEDRREFVERFELLKQIAPVWHDMGVLGPPPAEPHFPDPDILASALQPLQGEWRYRQYDYDLLIVGDTGVMTRVSRPKQRLGAAVLRFTGTTGNKLRGTHEFEDGNWYDVEAELTDPNTLHLHAAAWDWAMERLKGSTLIQSPTAARPGESQP